MLLPEIDTEGATLPFRSGRNAKAVGPFHIASEEAQCGVRLRHVGSMRFAWHGCLWGHRPTGEQSLAAVPPGHVYVAQGSDVTSKVYRYSLRPDGLPSTLPDGELTLGFPFPAGIAIGPEGDLYVSSAGNGNACDHTCFVAVFVPGASGSAKPIRVLDIPQGPLFIAIDQRGYLDVHSYKTGYLLTDVYAPNASGHDPPINEFKTTGVNALAASHSLVYIQTSESWVQSAGEHSTGRGVRYYRYPYYSANGVAIDGRQLYAEVYYPVRRSLYLGTEVFDLDQPSAPLRLIVGGGCHELASGGALGYGVAVFKRYLFESCIDGQPAGLVQVYDATKSGLQQPIRTLHGGLAGIAIGP